MTEQNKAANYKVIARKYRPQTFQEVVGQKAIVETLKNGIRLNKLAHAYLFSGPRGTGKTTLARLLAKAINCQSPTADFEPCNTCHSCKEILSGNSLDVLEIDGASNRGIEDIRQINETVSYASSGKYKVYIIDEVHMLTKEAFNALLKTLEEPPLTVKFFFATTEPHKVLPTILSRCQHFSLQRLSNPLIEAKLTRIAEDLQRTLSKEAARLIAIKAEGGLRDAESILDQIFAFYEGAIGVDEVASVLGLMPQEVFFQFDKAAKEGRLSYVFELTSQIFSQGKDLGVFLNHLTNHFRSLLVCKLAGSDSSALELTNEERTRYKSSSDLYTKEQLLTILDDCLATETSFKQAISLQIQLEGLLLRIMRTHRQIPIDQLVEKLLALEERVLSGREVTETPIAKPVPVESIEIVPQQTSFLGKAMIQPKKEAPSIEVPKKDTSPKEVPVKEAPPKETPQTAPPITPPVAPSGLAPRSPRYDTLLQFAAIELEGKIIKK